MDKVASRAHHHHHQHQHSHQHPHNHHHLHAHHHHHHHHHQQQQHHQHHPLHHHSLPAHHYPNLQTNYSHHDRQEQPEVNQNYDNQSLNAVGSQLAAQSKRKEKARIAARARRSQEAQIILEMANELHISQEKIRRIDKATIVKLAIDYIKAFEILCRFCSSCCQPALAEAERPPTETTSTSTTKTTTTHETERQDGDRDDTTTSTACTRPIQPARAAPKLSTGLIFAPRTDDMDSHFLMIRERDGRAAFVLKPDSEILDDDDLTHLAPQAGDTSISLEVEPLEGIVLDTGLFAANSPKCAAGKLGLLAGDTCCGSDETAV